MYRLPLDLRALLLQQSYDCAFAHSYHDAPKSANYHVYKFNLFCRIMTASQNDSLINPRWKRRGRIISECFPKAVADNGAESHPQHVVIARCCMRNAWFARVRNKCFEREGASRNGVVEQTTTLIRHYSELQFYFKFFIYEWILFVLYILILKSIEYVLKFDEVTFKKDIQMKITW